MAPVLWTFAGVLSLKDLAIDAGDAQWNKTSNGWPDELSLRHWGKMMVAVKTERKLKKMLIFVDNAAIHMDLEIAALFAKNNIVLLGLIPSGTSKMQPLDKLFFGPVKRMFPTIASEHGLAREYCTVAQIFKLCVDKMEATAAKRKSSVLASAFKQCGLYPFNPDIFSDKAFGESDFRLGIKKGDAAVLKAREVGLLESEAVVEAHTFEALSKAEQKLGALADAKRAARLASAKVGDTTIDKDGALKRSVFTSISWHEAAVADQAAKAKVISDTADRVAARAAKALVTTAEKKARSEAFQIRVAEGKKKKEEKAAAKLLKNIGTAPPLVTEADVFDMFDDQEPAAPAPKAGKKTARAPAEAGNQYAKTFVAKKARLV